MTADERASALVIRWVRLYTRRLPARAAFDRRAEIASDLWEQRVDASADGCPPAAVTRSILMRAIVGVPADLAWRHAERTRLISRQLRLVETDATPTVIGDSRWQEIRRRLRSRRCHACGQRYPRRLPNCPACKMAPLEDRVDRRSGPA